MIAYAATTASSTETEASAAATSTRANTAETAAVTLKGAVTPMATNLNNKNTAQETGAAHPSQTAVGVAETESCTTNHERPAPPYGTTGPRDPTQEED